MTLSTMRLDKLTNQECIENWSGHDFYDTNAKDSEGAKLIQNWEGVWKISKILLAVKKEQ